MYRPQDKAEQHLNNIDILYCVTAVLVVLSPGRGTGKGGMLVQFREAKTTPDENFLLKRVKFRN